MIGPRIRNIRAERWLPWSLSLLPPLFMLLAIAITSVNVPMFDEWELVPLIQRWRDGTVGLAGLLALHNGHRLLFPRLLILSLSGLTHWDVRVEQYVSFVLCLAAFAELYVLLRLDEFPRHLRPWLSLTVGLWLFSSVQADNWQMGLEVERYLCLAMTLAVLLALTYWAGKPEGLLVGIVAAVVASYSFGDGLAAWPVGLLAICSCWRHRLKASIAWCVAASISLGLYVYGFAGLDRESGLYGVRHPFGFAGWLLAYIGGWAGQSAAFVAHLPGVHLSPGDDPALRLGVATAAGGAAVAALVSVMVSMARRPDRRERWLPGLLLCAITLVDALLTAEARIGLGSDSALEGRYTTASLLLWIGLSIPAADAIVYLWKSRGSRPMGALMAVGPLLLAMILYGSSYAYGIARLELRSSMLRAAVPVLDHLDAVGQNDGAILSWLYPSTDYLRDQVALLKVWRYGPFKE